MQDLLDSTTGNVHDTYDPDREVVGLDVYAASPLPPNPQPKAVSPSTLRLTMCSGTGCCSIYPLLGCKTRPRWKFIATGISYLMHDLDHEQSNRSQISMSKTRGPHRRTSPGTRSSPASKSSRPSRKALYSHLTNSPTKRKYVSDPQQPATLTPTNLASTSACATHHSTHPRKKC